MKDPGAKSTRSSLKLQLDCGLCSSATYKESLSHKPTQAEETWGGGRGRESDFGERACEQTSECLPAMILMS